MAMICAMLLLASVHGEGQSPIILIYCGPTMEWGEALADIIRDTGQFEAEIQLVDDRQIYETVVNFPRVQAVIVCPITRLQATLEDISDMTIAYFEDGGAVIGLGDACTSRYAPQLGPSVFSIGGNRSLRSQTVDGRTVFEYVKKESLEEINGGLPSKLYMEGYLAFYSSDRSGNYVEIPAPGTRHVLYEGDKGAPLIVAHELADGGASVAFPGLTVQDNPDRNNYFGYLTEREEFRELFINSLSWTIDNSPRYSRLKEISEEALSDEVSRRADLAQEAEELQNRIEKRRLLRLGFLWAVGIAVSLVIVFKVVLIRD